MNMPRKVYAIRHNPTNRVYVGSSAEVEERFKAHISALKGHRHIVEDMQADFDKYGDDYSFTILDEIASYEERHKEYEWMKKLASYKRGVGYNYKDHHITHYLNREQEKPIIQKRPKFKPEPQDYECNGLTKNEAELMKIMYESKNPTVAMMKACAVISLFLAAETQSKALMNSIQ